MAETPDPFRYWNSALDGEPCELTPGRAECGYYRLRQRDGSCVGVHVWRQSNGNIAVKIGDGGVELIPCKRFRTEAEFVEQVFGYCAKHPVETDAYDSWKETGRWPDMPEDVSGAVAERLHGQNAEDHIVLRETIEELLAEARKWLDGIGGKITTKEQADKAANYADRFAEIRKEADDKHKIEKAPHLEAGRQVDNRWKPLQGSASDAVRWAKNLTTQWLAAEKARKLQEAAERAQRGEAVREQDLKVTAGTRGRAVSARAKRVGLVTDPAAFAAHLVETKNPDLIALLNTIANRIAHAGATAPGIEVKTEQVAA